MLELFPYLSNAKVDYIWGGLVDLSMDQMVHAGVHDGLYYSLLQRTRRADGSSHGQADGPQWPATSQRTCGKT